MQFSVPQFTDVEDRLVGGLSFKQFGIVFGAGVIIFAFYTLTKSLIATIFVALLVGLPAVGIAFIPFNGRPVYTAFGPFVRYFTGAKLFVFHKQAKSLPSDHVSKIAIKEQPPEPLKGDAAVVRMKQLNYLLQQQASEEQLLLDRIAAEKRKNR